MKPQKAIPVGLFAATLLLIFASFLAPLGDEKWRQDTVKTGNPSFVQLEIVNGAPVVGYTNGSGIVMAERKERGSLKDYLTGSTEYYWDKTRITASRNSGFFLSMDSRNGEVSFAHQYGILGDRKLGYTEKRNGSWQTDMIDSSTGTGLEPGVYASHTSIGNRTVVFYHNADGDQFIKAEREGDSWQREVLATETGQFIKADSCDEKAFVIYRSREQSQLKKGTLEEGQWMTEEIGGDTRSDMGIDASNCRFRAVLHNTETGNIEFVGDAKETIAEGANSRVSVGYREEPAVSYYIYGEGLFFAERSNSGWKTMPVDLNGSYVGERNEIEIQPDGTESIVYTEENSIRYAERSDGAAPLRRALRLLGILCLIPAVASVYFLEEELLILKSKVFKQLGTN